MTDENDLDALTEEAEEHVGPEPSKADALVSAVLDTGIELFRTPVDAPYARMVVEARDGSTKHQEVWGVKSDEFKLWLRKFAYESSGGRTPAKQVLNDVVDSLAARAQFEGAVHRVHVRVAGYRFDSDDPEIYLDLADEEWRVVKITRDAWEVIPGHEASVRFRRSRGTRPLPEPTRGGRLDDLKNVLNIREQDWPVVVSFLVGTLHPDGPYFVLVFVGEADSGKTNTVEKLCAVIDPRTPKHRRTWHGEKDIAIWTMNARYVALDNLSSLTDEKSDQLCRVTTGGGFGSRALYTDSDENVFEDERRMVVIASTVEVIARDDLLSRSMICEVPRLEAYGAELDLKKEFDRVHAGVLGSVLDGAVMALRRRDEVRAWPTDDGARWPRPVDLVQWASAAERAYGFADGAIVKAWVAHRNEAARMAVASSPLGRALLALQRPWQGTPNALLTELERVTPGYQYLSRDDWPASESVLGQRVRALQALLRLCGVHVSRGSTGGRDNRRYIRVE